MANGTLSQVGEQRVLDVFTTRFSATAPTIYAALVTGTSSATSAGTEITTQYTGYARQALTGGSWSGAVLATGVSTYNAIVNFGNNTAGAGATIIGIELFDAITTGNRLWWAPFSGGNITLPNSSGQIQFASGTITATIPPLSSNSGFSQTYAQRLCNYATGNATYTAPAAYYFFLSSAASSATAVGTEVTYTSYARTQLTSPSTNFNAATAASPSIVTAGVQIAWPTVGATAGTTAAHWGIADASSAGNLVYGDTLTGSYVPVTGQTPVINATVSLIKLT